MLEGDVVLGKLNSNITNNYTTDIPIMAHPPAKESDLSLEDFITNSNNGSKGIKLDFKTDEAFNKSKPILMKLRQNVRIYIHASFDYLERNFKA